MAASSGMAACNVNPEPALDAGPDSGAGQAPAPRHRAPTITDPATITIRAGQRSP